MPAMMTSKEDSVNSNEEQTDDELLRKPQSLSGVQMASKTEMAMEVKVWNSWLFHGILTMAQIAINVFSLLSKAWQMLVLTALNSEGN